MEISTEMKRITKWNYKISLINLTDLRLLEEDLLLIFLLPISYQSHLGCWLRKWKKNNKILLWVFRLIGRIWRRIYEGWWKKDNERNPICSTSFTLRNPSLIPSCRFIHNPALLHVLVPEPEMHKNNGGR